MTRTDTVVIPSLGEVTGTYDLTSKTVKFLGIPYGSVSKRWTRATELKSLPHDRHDGSKFGPICPQVRSPEAPSMAQLSVAVFPADPAPTFDEFKCLNLNIVKPDTDATDLPVMVWIHGGGFAVGSNTELIYNGEELVTSSAQSGTPVIYVAVNYRLGPFGFLSSPQLLDEAQGGAVGNYGLFDQRLALQFIRTHIASFGGSPSKITIFGESAGGASVHAHIISSPPLCAAAICQSGVTRTLGPFSASHPFQSRFYNEIAAQLGHKTAPAPDVLRAAPAIEIVGAISLLFGKELAIGLITDDSQLEGGFFPRTTDWVTPQPWLDRLMIGTCAVEGVIMVPNMMRISPPDLVSFMNSEHSLPQEVLARFGLDFLSLEKIPEMNPPLMARLVELQTAAAFVGPTDEVIAKARKESTWVYRMNRPNKWGKGVFADVAHHTIDLIYLAGVAKTHPTSELEVDVKLGEALVRHWIDFAIGKEPWSAAGKANVEMIYGVDGSVKEKKVTQSETGDALNLIGHLAAKALTVNVALTRGYTRF